MTEGPKSNTPVTQETGPGCAQQARCLAAEREHSHDDLFFGGPSSMGPRLIVAPCQNIHDGLFSGGPLHPREITTAGHYVTRAVRFAQQGAIRVSAKVLHYLKAVVGHGALTVGKLS